MSEVLEEVKKITAESERVLKKGEEAIKEAKDLMAQAEKNGAKKEDLDAIKEEYGKQIKSLSDQLDSLETQQKKAGSNAQEQKSFGDLVEDQLNAHKSQLDSIRNSTSGADRVGFNVKAVGTQLLANYNGGTGIGLTSWDRELARTPRINPFMRQLVSVRPINSLYIAWAEFVGGEGGADVVAEGQKKPQKDFDYTEASAKVEKIAVFTKASKEALADISFLRGEINSELTFEVEKKLDQQVLSGTGVSPQMKGILTYAPTFNVTGLPFAAGVAAANRSDVLMVAGAVIANNGFDANIAVVNPLDAAMMQLQKDANDNYIMPPFVAANGQTVAGLRVVANRGVAVGSFLVGDFNRDVLAIREEINLQIGYENDDFTKNLITILAEMRAVNYIKAQYVPAFVKGTFSTAITAITAA